MLKLQIDNIYMNKINAFVNGLHNTDLGILLIRIAVGITFIYAGWFKLSNIDIVIEGFGTMGFVPVLAYLVSIIEFLGGISMILGICARYSGILLSIIMLVAVIKVHGPMGYSLQNSGYEYVLVLLLASSAITALGSGKYSVMTWWRERKATQKMF